MEWVGDKPIMYVNQFDKHNVVLYVGVKSLVVLSKQDEHQIDSGLGGTVEIGERKDKQDIYDGKTSEGEHIKHIPCD